MKYPYIRKSFDRENKSMIIPIIGMTLTISMFTLWLLGFILLYYGSMIKRTIIVIIYIYQLIIADRNPLLKNFLYLLQFERILQELHIDSKRRTQQR